MPSRKGRGRPEGNGWQRPTFLLKASEPAEVHVVEQARLTGFRTGPLRTATRPNRWLRGAAYDAQRRLVPASQRMRGEGGDFFVAADPNRGPGKTSASRLTGTWLYGGHWMGPFGHFITETLTNLWAPSEDVAGLVFHRWLSSDLAVEPWQQDLVDRAGHPGLPVEIVNRKSVDVDRLLVPGRPFVVGGWVEPQAVEVWRRVGRTLERAEGPDRVYLSRTTFNAALVARGRTSRTSPERDAQLDAEFAAAGFTIVDPESLPVTEQIRLITGASVIAGAAGSALHLAAFTLRPSKVIEVADARSESEAVRGQRLINAACGHLAAIVAHDERPRDVLERLDLDAPV